MTESLEYLSELINTVAVLIKIDIIFRINFTLQNPFLTSKDKARRKKAKSIEITRMSSLYCIPLLHKMHGKIQKLWQR